MSVRSIPSLIRDARPRWFRRALALALLVHLPLTPVPMFVRWLGPLLNRERAWDYEDSAVVVPISLLDSETHEDTAGPAPSPVSGSASLEPTGAAGPSAAHAPARRAPGGGRTRADAGVHREESVALRGPRDPLDAGLELTAERGSPSEIVDAGAGPDSAPAESRDGATAVLQVADASAERLVARASLDAGARVSDAGAAGLADSLKFAGDLAKTMQGRQNIVVLLWFSTIREHPLGRLAGDLFTCIPQWREFLRDSIDPLRDLDGVMLFGPRMSDTSKLTILVQTRLEAERVREELSLAIRKTSGGWLDAGPGALAARVRLDRADRIAFTHPSRLVVFAPPEAYEQLQRIPEPLSLPSASGRAVSLVLQNPWRPARGLGLSLPDSLSELRLHVMAAPDGGVDLSGELDDRDPASAAEHLASVTTQVASLLGPFAGDVHLTTKERRIVGGLHLSRVASMLMLGWVRGQVCPSARVGDAGAHAR